MDTIFPPPDTAEIEPELVELAYTVQFLSIIFPLKKTFASIAPPALPAELLANTQFCTREAVACKSAPPPVFAVFW